MRAMIGSCKVQHLHRASWLCVGLLPLQMLRIRADYTWRTAVGCTFITHELTGPFPHHQSLHTFLDRLPCLPIRHVPTAYSVRRLFQILPSRCSTSPSLQQSCTLISMPAFSALALFEISGSCTWLANSSRMRSPTSSLSCSRRIRRILRFRNRLGPVSPLPSTFGLLSALKMHVGCQSTFFSAPSFEKELWDSTSSRSTARRTTASWRRC